MGYHIQPGFIWRQEYIVAPLKGSREAIDNDDLRTLRVKRMELPIGDLVFPLAVPEDQGGEPPKLDDQECTFPPKDQGVLAVDGEMYTDGRDPLAPWDPSGIDLDEELAKLRQRSSEPIYVPDEEKPPPGEGLSSGSSSPSRRGGPGSLTDKPDSDLKPKHSITSHDPHTMPDGKPVPEGYGIRLVRNKKGSKRPPDTSSEEWHNMSRGQREADIERYQARLKRESAARAEEERDAAPAMPTKQCVDEPHRVKTATLYWEKLGEISELQYALVARVVNQAEIDRTPAAKQAMGKEWQKLVDKSCWLHSKVREFRDVSAEAIRKGIQTHFGRIFEICSIKGDELPEGHDDRKWKGRSVFQGNRVSDEHIDHAIFSELGSSPASMEAAKVIDVFGSQPGYSKQQADAKQAYTQALFKGVETWVRLPRNRWPKEWQGFQDPVVPLLLALYGHPDSGGIWEKHCEDQLKTVGWTPVLPEIWQSIFYHAELDLLLVIYVDDFKMAGPAKNLDKGWKTVESVIDMDPPEPFGRYFGCNHFEKTQVKLPRSAHPFAYVFDKKTAAPARGDPRPQVREDYWEVDTKLGAVVRHHVYPRKRLYVPTNRDIELFPNLSTTRITEVDEGPTEEHDTNLVPDLKREEWWTGRSLFPLPGHSGEQIRHALAASKGKPSRSKAEAKREARELKFKGTDTICKEPTPSMEKPVNVMTYDMRDFLVSCVDRYCDLAKVQKQSLATVPTPFSENRVAKPMEGEEEPTGRLQPIASKVLMKILFAARMARWDLLRATQSLASRVTKWSRDCDAALHRLVCYINSSLDIRMQGFIGDRINECKLWLFSDADWSGEHDRKSTSGCALYLVGPNTYYPLNAFSKKQTSITMSSTESEVISANHGVRAQGLPSLSLWMFLWQQVEIDPANHQVRPKRPPPVKIDGVLARIDPELDEIRYGGSPGGRSVANLQGLHVGLSDKFRVQFLEDNQATITIVNKGDSEKMRHTDRTQNISFGWLKQQFEAEHFDMVNVDTLEQVADIFTKPFAEKTKWLHALRLINHNLCSDVAQNGGQDSDSHLVAKPTIAAAGHGRPSLESVAQDLLRVKDFSYHGLCSLASDFPTKVSKRRKSRLATTEDSYYHNWGFFSFSGMQGITNITKRFPDTCLYLNEWIRKHARKGFTWTSIAVNRDAKSLLHADSRNLKSSDNFAISFGNFTGGFYGLRVPKAKAPEPRPRQMERWFLVDPMILRTLLYTSPRICTTA